MLTLNSPNWIFILSSLLKLQILYVSLFLFSADDFYTHRQIYFMYLTMSALIISKKFIWKYIIATFHLIVFPYLLSVNIKLNDTAALPLIFTGYKSWHAIIDGTL
jgi:hypothetical protein